MRILVIHQFYLRPGAPGGSRFNEFADAWRAAGHEVRVVASSVPYATGLRTTDAPWPWVERPEEGIGVVRTWAVQHPSGAFVARLASMASYAGLASLAATVGSYRPDVVVASSPTLASFLPGLIAASRWGARLILEVRDLWPESVISMGGMREESSVARAAYGFEEAAYELADIVVALTPGIRDRLVERQVVAPERCVVIPNGVDLGALQLSDRMEVRRRLGFGDKFVAVYTGAHGIANGLDQVVDAAAALAQDDIEILCIGEGPEKGRLVEQTRRRRVTNLQWLPAVSKAELFDYLVAADAGIVTLRSSETFQTVYPNKMFDYMAASLPIVLGVEGVAADILAAADAGLCVQPERPEQIASALRTLRDNPARGARWGANGRRCVERDFDRVEHAKAYLEVMHGP